MSKITVKSSAATLPRGPPLPLRALIPGRVPVPCSSARWHPRESLRLPLNLAYLALDDGIAPLPALSFRRSRTWNNAGPYLDLYSASSVLSRFAHRNWFSRFPSHAFPGPSARSLSLFCAALPHRGHGRHVPPPGCHVLSRCCPRRLMPWPFPAAPFSLAAPFVRGARLAPRPGLWSRTGPFSGSRRRVLIIPFWPVIPVLPRGDYGQGRLVRIIQEIGDRWMSRPLAGKPGMEKGGPS